MSSAENHRKRSHRSHRAKAAMLNNFRRTNMVRSSPANRGRMLRKFFEKIFGK